MATCSFCKREAKIVFITARNGKLYQIRLCKRHRRRYVRKGHLFLNVDHLIEMKCLKPTTT